MGARSSVEMGIQYGFVLLVRKPGLRVQMVRCDSRLNNVSLQVKLTYSITLHVHHNVQLQILVIMN